MYKLVQVMPSTVRHEVRDRSVIVRLFRGTRGLLDLPALMYKLKTNSF
jgi:hypothetical protein